MGGGLKQPVLVELVQAGPHHAGYKPPPPQGPGERIAKRRLQRPARPASAQPGGVFRQVQIPGSLQHPCQPPPAGSAKIIDRTTHASISTTTIHLVEERFASFFLV